MNTHIETPAAFWSRRRELFPSNSQRGTAVSDLVDLFVQHRVKTVADFGCGPGEATVALRHRGMRMLAVDSDSRSTHALRRRLGLSRDLALYNGDWRMLRQETSFVRAFDAVYCIGNALVYVDSWRTGQLQEWTRSISASLRSMAALLRRGGICYLDVTSRRDIGVRTLEHVVGQRRFGKLDVTVGWTQELHGMQRILHAHRISQNTERAEGRAALARMVSYAIDVTAIALLADMCGFSVEAAGAVLPREQQYEGLLLRKR